MRAKGGRGVSKLTYILQGRTVVPEPDIVKWARWFETADRRVALTELTEYDVKISTVFLGVDYGMGDCRPLLFETLVFGGVMDGDMIRTSSWTGAEEAHTRMVMRVRITEEKEAERERRTMTC